MLTNDLLGHWANDKMLLGLHSPPPPPLHVDVLASMVTIKQQSHKAAHLPGSRAAPGALLQMFDPQVPPGHGDLLVGICSSADDILKGVLLPRDLCALQGNS